MHSQRGLSPTFPDSRKGFRNQNNKALLQFRSRGGMNHASIAIQYTLLKEIKHKQQFVVITISFLFLFDRYALHLLQKNAKKVLQHQQHLFPQFYTTILCPNSELKRSKQYRQSDTNKSMPRLTWQLHDIFIIMDQGQHAITNPSGSSVMLVL